MKARLQRLLQRGRNRWRLDCEILQKLAEHYAEHSVGWSAVEVAGRTVVHRSTAPRLLPLPFLTMSERYRATSMRT